MLQYLDLASRANAGQESAIDEFFQELLRMLRFEERGLLLRTRYKIPLTICADSTCTAQTDVCRIHPTSVILLLLQGDKTVLSSKAPEAQIIAEAIAAFQSNNRARDAIGLPRLTEMVFPCITMIGTRPMFYQIPVTSALSEAVITAQYPAQTTLVVKCSISGRRISESMETVGYRRTALQYFTTFRALARSLWQGFLVEPLLIIMLLY